MEPDIVLSDLTLLYPRIYIIVEQAISTAKDYFITKNSEVDRYLFATIVRNEIKQALDFLSNDPELLNNGYSRKELQNNGLEIYYANYNIKILKSQQGYIPSAGKSIAKQNFFYQPSLPFMEEQIVNLVIIWDVNLENELAELRLACPRQSMNYPETTLQHWSINIPSSISSTENITYFDEPVEDLDIALDTENTEATGTFGNQNDND